MNQIQIITTAEGLQSAIDNAVQEAFRCLQLPQQETNPGLLSRKDAAKYLGISTPTLDNLTRSKQINPIRIGRQVKFDHAELTRFSNNKKKG